MCGGRGAHDWLGEEGSTSGGLKVHCLCTYVLLSCVYIYLRSASEEFKEHKSTVHILLVGCTPGGLSFNSTALPRGVLLHCCFGKLYFAA